MISTSTTCCSAEARETVYAVEAHDWAAAVAEAQRIAAPIAR
jgi:hypothetical protein